VRRGSGSPLAGNIGGDLKDVHAAPGEDSGGEELHALAVAGGGACDLDDGLAADLRHGRLRGLRGGLRRGLGLLTAGKEGDEGQSEGRDNELDSIRHDGESPVAKRFGA
jgi:hypothetical protein